MSIACDPELPVVRVPKPGYLDLDQLSILIRKQGDHKQGVHKQEDKQEFTSRIHKQGFHKQSQGRLIRKQRVHKQGVHKQEFTTRSSQAGFTHKVSSTIYRPRDD